LGERAFDTDVWKVIGEYCYDDQGGRHQAFFTPTRDVEVLGEHIRAGERIQIEQSLKYLPNEAQKLWKQAAMVETKHWQHIDEYGKQTRRFRVFIRSQPSQMALPPFAALSEISDFCMRFASPRSLRLLATTMLVITLSPPRPTHPRDLAAMATPVTGLSGDGCPRHLGP
jgi:uncharacterized SAM-dependent methyltransferase